MISTTHINAPHEEKTILGILLMDGIQAMEHCTRLRAEMFSLDSHRRMYGVMQEMLMEGCLLDDVALYGELTRRKMEVGGIEYIMSLSEGIPRHFNPSQHVRVVIERWKLRQVQRMCQAYSARADELENAAEVLADMQADVMDIIAEQEMQDNPHVMAYSVAALEKFIYKSQQHADVLMGRSYGLPRLDEFTEGMQAGQVTVVGARSGVGKSTLMIQATHANAKAGIPVHLFSLEMSRDEVLGRLWAIESKVPYFKIRKPSLCSEFEKQYIKDAAMQIADWPIRINDKSDMDLDEVCGLARLSVRKNKTEIIAVDYAQNMEADGRDEKTKVSKVSRTLTKLSKDEGNHLMLLSQLRKVPNEQYSKPPHVGDLRETGQLENDAHVVLLIHRAWDEENAKLSSGGEIIIPKQRGGETGAIEMTLNRSSVTFE